MLLLMNITRAPPKRVEKGNRFQLKDAQHCDLSRYQLPRLCATVLSTDCAVDKSCAPKALHLPWIWAEEGNSDSFETKEPIEAPLR